MNVKDLEIWERLVRSHADFMTASRDFLSNEVDRVSIIKQVLQLDPRKVAKEDAVIPKHVPYGRPRATAIYFLKRLSSDELKQIFDELIFWVRDHGSALVVRQAILSIPKEWLLENIEIAIEPYLQTGEGEEYRRFLELFSEIDPELTRRLALRALEQDDYDAREAGQDFLDKLNRTEDTTGSA